MYRFPWVLLVNQQAWSIGEVYGPTAQCEKSIDSGSMTKESVGWGAATGLIGALLAGILIAKSEEFSVAIFGEFSIDVDTIT